ncbi:MAG: GNAT family N-acetyltransferase [Anaeromyxobacter sp.]
MPASHVDDPFERSARQPSPAGFRIRSFSPDDPTLLATLRGWQLTTRRLLAQAASADTRARLEDSRRIVDELVQVLTGDEDGEGVAEERLVRAAVSGGEIQAFTTVFLCPRAAFIELLATAPWNLLGPGDPPDRRAVRGAGRALVQHASALARAAGAGGRVALQAENPRSLAVYERLGFGFMRPSDAPLALVPRGDKGWSAAVVRLARGAPGPDERRAPWLLFDPDRPERRVGAAVLPFRSSAGAVARAAARPLRAGRSAGGPPAAAAALSAAAG